MSDRAIITVDELIEETRPETLSERMTRIARLLREAVDGLQRLTDTINEAAEAAARMAEVWDKND